MSCAVIRIREPARANASLEHRRDAQPLADLARLGVLPLERERRRARGDVQSRRCCASALMMSSAMPSPRNSLSRSGLRFTNGSTAIECGGGSPAFGDGDVGRREQRVGERGDVGKRSIGVRASAWCNARATCRGTPSRSAVTSAGVWTNRLAIIACDVRPGERRFAHEHLVEHAAERVQVAASVDGFARRLLRAHVRRRADRHAGLRHAPSSPAALHRLADAEVGDERVAVLQQDVLRLDVAVHDALARARRPARRPPRARCAPRPATGSCGSRVEPVAQRLARARPASRSRGRPPASPESNSGRMCGCDSRAASWISRRKRSRPSDCGEIGVQHLERDVAAVLEVVREVDGRHAAAPSSRSMR